MFLENSSVVHVEDLACHKRTDYGAYSISDKGEADLGVIQVVSFLEERRHGCDGHLPDGVVH